MARWILKFASYKKRNDIFDAVKRGEKTIETRSINLAAKRNYSQVKPEDILVMLSLDTKERIEKIVTFVHIYKSVAEMAKKESTEKIIPGVKTSKELIDIFEELKKKWGRSYANKLEKYGIVAMGFK
jgi:ASC-1-like (ASCH) protein